MPRTNESGNRDGRIQQQQPLLGSSGVASMSVYRYCFILSLLLTASCAVGSIVFGLKVEPASKADEKANRFVTPRSVSLNTVVCGDISRPQRCDAYCGDPWSGDLEGLSKYVEKQTGTPLTQGQQNELERICSMPCRPNATDTVNSVGKQAGVDMYVLCNYKNTSAGYFAGALLLALTAAASTVATVYAAVRLFCHSGDNNNAATARISTPPYGAVP